MSDADDPVRISRSASGAEGPLVELFRAAEGDVASQAELASLSSRLGPLLDAPVPAPRSMPLTKLVAVGAGGALLAALGLAYLLTRSVAPASTSVVAPSAVTTSSSSPAAPGPVPTEVAPPEAALAPSTETPSAASEPSAKPAQRAQAPNEAALLEQARRALATDPARALSLTRRHQALFPHGALAQEREVIAIEALRRLGDKGSASERANSFQQQFPDSAHRRSVEEGLKK